MGPSEGAWRRRSGEARAVSDTNFLKCRVVVARSKISFPFCAAFVVGGMA